MIILIIVCVCICVQVADLDTLKQSSRLVHYCATPLLFDPVFRKQIQEELIVQPLAKVSDLHFLSLPHSLSPSVSLSLYKPNFKNQRVLF